MTALRRLGPAWPALLLAGAFALGGMRGPAGWLAFGAAAACWLYLAAPRPAAAAAPWPALFFLWLGAAALFSPEPAASLPVFARWALLGALFSGFASLPSARGWWLKAVYALGAAAAAALLWQRLSGGWVTGLIGDNPNYSAAFCAAGFAAALSALPAAAGVRGKAALGALSALLLAGVLASGSRGALLAALAGAGAGLAAARSWRLLAALGGAVLLGAALLPGEALSGLLKMSDPRAFARPRLWGAALEAAAASPMLGWGPGLFGPAFEIFKFPFFDGLSYFGHNTPHAHGEFFNLAAEAGLPAAVFLLLAAGRGLLRPGGSLPLKACALAVLVQASGDMIFWSGAVALLFWGSFGLALAEEPAAPPARGLYAAVLPAALLLGLLAAFPAGQAAGRKAFVGLTAAEAGGNPAAALALARSEALANPLDPLLPEAEGRLLAALGDRAGAEAAFARALAIEPNFNQARLELAGFRAAAGRRDEACALLAALEAAPAVPLRTPYLRALVLHDEQAAEKLRKKICGKKKTGGATAPGRKTP